MITKKLNKTKQQLDKFVGQTGKLDETELMYVLSYPNRHFLFDKTDSKLFSINYFINNDNFLKVNNSFPLGTAPNLVIKGFPPKNLIDEFYEAINLTKFTDIEDLALFLVKKVKDMMVLQYLTEDLKDDNE